MRIAIDISQIIYGTGVSVYTKKLVENLLLIDKANQYVLFGGSLRRSAELKQFISQLKGNVIPVVIPFPPTAADLFWNRLGYPKVEMFTGKIDVFHASDWSHPPTDAAIVTTIHDLFPIKFPKEVNKKVYSAHKARLKRVLARSHRIIVPSNATKADVAGLGFPEEMIEVIYEAVGEEFSPATNEQVEKLKNKLNVSRYLLSVGTGTRKNTSRIITAYEKAKRKDLKLLIVGRIDERHAVKRGVRFLGQVPTEELVVLYSGAEALVYPSLYEGFGLPILEAFACGCPVVTSNLSSMAEVAGDAAVLVDPLSSANIARGIKEALSRPKTLVDKGKKRVKDFSWETMAKQTLAVYQSLGKGSRA